MDPAHILRQRAQELVAKLICQKGTDAPPFLATELANLLGSVEVKRADLGKRDAVLLTLGGRHLVKVNQSHHPIRQNFSLAHELGHILLNQTRPAQTASVDFRGVSHETEERLCNLAAAQLLMPEAVFRKHLTVLGLSIDSLEPLAQKFQTSREATARRMVEVSEEPCVAVCWRLARRPRSLTLPCAVWSATNADPAPQQGPTVRRGSSVPANSSIASAFVQPEATRGFEALQVGSTKKKAYVESKGIGRGEDRRVLSLVFPARRER